MSEVQQKQGIGDIPIKQIKELFEYWPIIATIGGVILFALSHFASSKSVKELDCKFKKQFAIQQVQSYLALLQQQHRDYSREIESLINLRAMVVEVNATNDTIDLSDLKEAIAKLEIRAQEERGKIDTKINDQSEKLASVQALDSVCIKETEQ